jgi:hypothetical protein
MIRVQAQEQHEKQAHSSARTGKRESAYATAALRGECSRVADAVRGSRNNTLFKAAASLGSMAAAGWLDEVTIKSELSEAAVTCGLVRDDGAHSAHTTIESGLQAGMVNPHPPLPEEERFGNFGTTSDEHAWGEPDPLYLGSGRSKPAPFPVNLLGSFWANWCEAHA